MGSPRGPLTPIELGTRFGSLVVIGFVPRGYTADGKKSSNRRIITLCDCGKVTTPIDSNLVKGRTRSCGHKQRIERKVTVRAATMRAMTGVERRRLLAAGDPLAVEL